MSKWNMQKICRAPWLLYIICTTCFLVSPSLSLRKLLYISESELAQWAVLAMAGAGYLLIMTSLTFFWILFKKYGGACIFLTIFGINGLLMGLAGISDRFPTLYQLVSLFEQEPYSVGRVVGLYELFLAWLLVWVICLAALYCAGQWLEKK